MLGGPLRRAVGLHLALLLACCGSDGKATGDGGGRDDAAEAGPAEAGPAEAGPTEAGPTDATPRDGSDDAGEPLNDEPTKGPWVVRVGATRAVVRWESRLAPVEAAVEYEPGAGGEVLTAVGESRETRVTAGYGEDSLLVEQPDLPGTYFMQEVAIGDLMPATCYRYRLVGFPSHEGRVCTMHEPTDHTTPVSFLVLGDTSPFLGATQRVLEHVLTGDPEFTVHVGDVQYYSAVLETWQLWFQEMAPLLRTGPMYAAIGNHENELDGAEFEDYYRRFWDDLSEDGDELAYHYATGGVHFFAINSEANVGPPERFEAQFGWLATRMDEVEAERGYRFSVLYFHRPIYTVADHAPSLELRARIEPIVREHTVPLVLQGHNHVYERFEVGDTTYLVVGGGGSGLYDLDEHVDDYPEEAAMRVAAGRFHHGALVTVDADTIHVEVVDKEGVARDSFDLPVPGP